MFSVCVEQANNARMRDKWKIQYKEAENERETEIWKNNERQSYKTMSSNKKRVKQSMAKRFEDKLLVKR